MAARVGHIRKVAQAWTYSKDGQTLHAVRLVCGHIVLTKQHDPAVCAYACDVCLEIINHGKKHA